MKTIATIVKMAPITIQRLIGSPITATPTAIAVMGSVTPKTDAFVGPINRVAQANAPVDTIVGKSANPSKFQIAVEGGNIMAPLNSAWTKNIAPPTSNA